MTDIIIWIMSLHMNMCRKCGAAEKVRKSSLCSTCKAKRDASYYHTIYKFRPRPPSQAKGWHLDRYQKNIEMIRLEKNKPCADCKNHFPYYVMDFDHVRGVKVGNVSTLALWSIARILEEISKCEVVCSNCHRIRTHIRKSCVKI